MNTRTLLASVLLAAGVAALPTAAFAAEDMGVLHVRTGAAVPVHPGETVTVPVGIANVSDKPVTGVVAEIRVLNDVNLPTTFSNCRYYVDSNVEGALCEFDTEFAPGKVYEIAGLQVSVEPVVKKDKLTPVIVRMLTPEWVKGQGGIDAFAAKEAGRGTSVKTGTAGPATLVEATHPLSTEGEVVGFAGLSLIVPPAPVVPTAPSSSAPAPTVPAAPSSAPAPVVPGSAPASAPTSAQAPAVPASASASVSATATGGAAAAPATPGTGGGDLAFTGSDAATVATVGVGALLLGTVGFFVARRRRTRFVA
ncbi:LPXTG cell wall anchor domain-containing protein [Actinoplanes sp. NPDC051859]|uniref:LPXTG cell wall anchor domain-containing protein n=1 Tax=Actinoplanes sp. NPDC051859 TaxID=3363909 RepID=UPI0037AE0AB8